METRKSPKSKTLIPLSLSHYPGTYSSGRRDGDGISISRVLHGFLHLCQGSSDQSPLRFLRYWVREYKVNGVLGPRSQSSFYARGSKEPRGAPGHSCLHFRAFAAETLLALDPRTRDGLAIPYQPRNFIRSRIPCGIVFVGASVAGRTPGVRAAGRAGAR